MTTPLTQLTVVILAFLPIIFRNNALWSLRPLFHTSPNIEIRFPTRQLGGARFWIIFCAFILRSIARRVGLLRTPSLSEGLPGISISMPFALAKADLQTYRQASGATQLTDDELLQHPLHAQLLLSALTEPAMLLLLARWDCPVDPVGSVNVRNRFELHDSQGITSALHQALELPSHDTSSGLVVHARLEQQAKAVKRGWEIKIIVDLKRSQEGGVESVLYRQAFTMLQFAKHKIPPSVDPSANTAMDETLEHLNSSLTLTAREPLLWANLSKDHNPIHTSSFAARLLGFKGRIAHGNHVVAKTISAIEGEISSSQGKWMEVEFKRPVFVPAQLEIARVPGQRQDGEEELSVVRSGKTLVSVRFAKSDG